MRGVYAVGRPEGNRQRRGRRDRHLPASPVRTLLDLAPRLSTSHLEAAINEADKHELLDPESLQAALERYPGLPGGAGLRSLLARATIQLTDSELERRFLRLVASAGLHRRSRSNG